MSDLATKLSRHFRGGELVRRERSRDVGFGYDEKLFSTDDLPFLLQLSIVPIAKQFGLI
jgi:hypothetical protein